MTTRDPYSQEAEQGLLGAMLIRPELIDLLSADVTDKDFYWDFNAQVYRAILKLKAIDRPVDFFTVGERVGELANGDSGLAYCAELHKNTPSAANAKEYARIVRERASDRKLAAAAMVLHELAYSDLDTADKMSQAQAEVMGLEGATSTAETITATEVMRGHVEELERRERLGGAMDGLSTGIKSLDTRMQGMKGGQLIIIAGRPKMGKTTLAMNIASYNAITARKSVLVYSFEMRNSQLIDRIIASEGGIPLNSLKVGSVFEKYPQEMVEVTNRINDSPLHMSVRSSLPISRIRAQARRHKMIHGLDLLVIDHVGLVDGERAGMSAVERVSEITRQAKLLGMELDVPVILLSQLNRALEARPNKRPIPSDLRDSGSIEQDADMILFVYRDEVYNENTESRGIAEIILAVARDVEPGTVKARYQGAYSKFSDLDTDYTPPPVHKPYATNRGIEF